MPPKKPSNQAGQPIAQPPKSLTTSITENNEPVSTVFVDNSLDNNILESITDSDLMDLLNAVDENTKSPSTQTEEHENSNPKIVTSYSSRRMFILILMIENIFVFYFVAFVKIQPIINNFRTYSFS